METVTFPGNFESLEAISLYITQAARSAGLDDSAVYQVQLAVDEACSNIIDHAYGGSGHGDIEMTVNVTLQGLTIILRDHGKPFDPQNAPEPNLSLPIEQLEPRGVGLYLMRKMMDDVRFEFSPRNGNLVTMTKNRRPQ
jgi:serine/threonine-protein kinase RsbW